MFHLTGWFIFIFGLFRLLSTIIKITWEWNVMSTVSLDRRKHLQVPPGSMGYPIIGETFSFLWKVRPFFGY